MLSPAIFLARPPGGDADADPFGGISRGSAIQMGSLSQALVGSQCAFVGELGVVCSAFIALFIAGAPRSICQRNRHRHGRGDRPWTGVPRADWMACGPAASTIRGGGPMNGGNSIETADEQENLMSGFLDDHGRRSSGRAGGPRNSDYAMKSATALGTRCSGGRAPKAATTEIVSFRSTSFADSN